MSCDDREWQNRLLTAIVEMGMNTMVSSAMDRICELSRFMSFEKPVLARARLRFVLLSSLAK